MIVWILCLIDSAVERRNSRTELTICTRMALIGSTTRFQVKRMDDAVGELNWRSLYRTEDWLILNMQC